MQDEHGGVAGYCQDVLGLDAGVIEAMRAALLV
jgi:hypothetical protein